MQTHDTLPFVIGAYAVTWVVLASYATYLWRASRRLQTERLKCE